MPDHEIVANPLRLGTISYNIHCNFTNYGSALQTWALHRAIKQLGKNRWSPLLVDYCPDVLRDKDPLSPLDHMWDADEESRRMCELSLPAIRINAKKFDRFYETQFSKSAKSYMSENFDEVVLDEKLDAFVCGSDTIFCIDEFGGFDPGFYGDYPAMRGRSVAYAASFGDARFGSDELEALHDRVGNFKALGLREQRMVSCVQNYTSAPVQRVLDPTLLLTVEDYQTITAPRQESGDYLLLYARRYDSEMERYAESLASAQGWNIVEISLRATNAEKHRMCYEAGVEEFLSLVKHARFVVTNSYHGMIFAVHHQKPFHVFSREQCNTKIAELLELLGLSNRLVSKVSEAKNIEIDYAEAMRRIELERRESLAFLENALELLQSETRF